MVKSEKGAEFELDKVRLRIDSALIQLNNSNGKCSRHSRDMLVAAYESICAVQSYLLVRRFGGDFGDDDSLS